MAVGRQWSLCLARRWGWKVRRLGRAMLFAAQCGFVSAFMGQTGLGQSLLGPAQGNVDAATAPQGTPAAPGQSKTDAAAPPLPIGAAASPLRTAEESVEVTAYRTPVAALESPVSTRVLDTAALRQAAPVGLDGKLRTVPGFDLFRRSSSLVANPTTEGVSLRGLGSTAASRTLVLWGDVPLNDPYGGWIHWEELPALAIGQVEVVRGGVSDLYGSSAVGGVVEVSAVPARTGGEPQQVLRLHPSEQERSPGTPRSAQDDPSGGALAAAPPAGGRRFAEPELVLESGYGAEGLNENDARVRGGRGRWSGLAATEVLGTDGYTLVAPNLRGPVDAHSNVHAQNGLVFGERALGPAGLGDGVWLRGNVLNEHRHNGTPLTGNSTRLWRYAAGLDRTGLGGNWQLRGWGSNELYKQNFSSVTTGRVSEVLTRNATDPADELGAARRWREGRGAKLVALAGADMRDVRAEDTERPTSRTTPATDTTARQTDVGAYGELLWTPGAWLVSGSARVDRFRNADAAAYTLATGARKTLPVIEQTVLDPRVGVSRRLGKALAVSASGFRAYRAPTENELYRTGQVGQQTTLPNAALKAERATGWETGLAGELPSGLGRTLGASWRGSYFWTEVNRPITALTLTTTPTATTLQRENLGQIRSRGVSLDGSVHPADWLTLTGGYQLARASVTRFPQPPQGPNLVGLWIPQVPRNTGTLQLTAARPRLGLLSLQLRESGRQYDDDANLYVLHGFTRFDVYASHQFGQHWEAVTAVENLLDRSVDVGRTPIRTLGTPQLARFGVRMTLGGKQD